VPDGPKMNIDRDTYLSMRRRYEPDVVRLAIVAESPPVSGRYFYNPAGDTSEPLFSALMRQLPFSPASKEIGLREFKRRGWVLVDATYEPVNLPKGSKRDKVIARDYHLLRDDLARLSPDRSVPLILIKKNVCRLLRLREDGFRGSTLAASSTFQVWGGRKISIGSSVQSWNHYIRLVRACTVARPCPLSGKPDIEPTSPNDRV
jgi:hypothetical protein